MRFAGAKVRLSGGGDKKKVAHNEVFNFLRVDKGVVCGVEVAKWGALGGAHRFFLTEGQKDIFFGAHRMHRIHRI